MLGSVILIQLFLPPSSHRHDLHVYFGWSGNLQADRASLSGSGSRGSQPHAATGLHHTAGSGGRGEYHMTIM